MGGGPGAPDLITIRAARILAAADVVIWGRPFAQEELVREHARPDAEIIAWPPATMADIHAAYDRARDEGLLVVRLFSGDTAVFSRLAEDVEALDARGVAWEVVPGITAYAAAAAALGRELTGGEEWRPLVVTSAAAVTRTAPTGEAMAIYMPTRVAAKLESELLGAGYPPTTSCTVAHRVGWPEAALLRCELADLAETIDDHALDGLALVLVEGREVEGA
jgi:precorrin-4/cobalt-precorrin-4 C11-methyltransferase